MLIKLISNWAPFLLCKEQPTYISRKAWEPTDLDWSMGIIGTPPEAADLRHMYLL
jgi:hypothetical protein